MEEEDEDAIRLKLLDQLEQDAPYTMDEFQDVLEKEFSVFKTGEKYDYVKDMHEAFDEDLAMPLSQKIIRSMPDHVFYDIKKPLRGTEFEKVKNPYNPARQFPFSSFFEYRDYEEYMDRRKLKNNWRDNISTYRRY